MLRLGICPYARTGPEVNRLGAVARGAVSAVVVLVIGNVLCPVCFGRCRWGRLR
jgi:hypothetical protein